MAALKRPGPERDWTKGGILNNLLSLSWPMVISSLINTMGPTIDMIWVGRLGQASIAGVGIAGMAVMVVNSMVMGIFAGLQAVVARHVGAGDKQGAAHVARQALAVSTAFSVVMAIVGVLFSEAILKLVGLAPDVIAEGTAYLRIQFVGMVTMTFQMMTNSAMMASGDSRKPMLVAILYRLFHVVISPFFIFGWWIFPRLGVSGSALTSVFSTGLGAGIGLWILFSGRTRLQLTMKEFRIDPVAIWRIVKVGVPMAVNAMERSLGQFFLMWFVVPYGTMAVAAHSVGQRVDMFIMMMGFTIGQAAGVLAGQNMGAGLPERAKKTAWTAVAVAFSILFTMSTVIWFWAENVAGVFTPSDDLAQLTGVYLRIQIVTYVMLSLVGVLMSVLSGVGDTVPVMLATLLSMWVVQVPLAYFLPKVTGLGVYGVWWAMAAGVVIRALAFVIYFRTGLWQRKKV
ncbi:MAG: MATE family efflux transporter [Chloroflexi bacterium]|nr:MATE family efflux transporter [Chloroflexota bacterium]